MRNAIAVVLLSVLLLQVGCWRTSPPTKPTDTGAATGTGSVDEAGPSGKGKGRTQDTLPDR